MAQFDHQNYSNYMHSTGALLTIQDDYFRDVYLHPEDMGRSYAPCKFRVCLRVFMLSLMCDRFIGIGHT